MPVHRSSQRNIRRSYGGHHLPGRSILHLRRVLELLPSPLVPGRRGTDVPRPRHSRGIQRAVQRGRARVPGRIRARGGLPLQPPRQLCVRVRDEHVNTNVRKPRCAPQRPAAERREGAARVPEPAAVFQGRRGIRGCDGRKQSGMWDGRISGRCGMGSGECLFRSMLSIY